MNELKVKVTAYKGYLIIETVKPEEDENFVPVGEGRLGCVLINTEHFLGMSEEAVTLIKQLKRNNDAIGDVSTWKTDDGRNCFSWFGQLKRLVNVEECECDRGGIIDIAHVTIDNNVPPEAIEVIES